MYGIGEEDGRNNHCCEDMLDVSPNTFRGAAIDGNHCWLKTATTRVISDCSSYTGKWVGFLADDTSDAILEYDTEDEAEAAGCHIGDWEEKFPTEGCDAEPEPEPEPDHDDHDGHDHDDEDEDEDHVEAHTKFTGELSFVGMTEDDIPDASSAEFATMGATIATGIASAMDGVETDWINIIAVTWVPVGAGRRLSEGHVVVEFEITVPATQDEVLGSFSADMKSAVESGELMTAIVAADESGAMADVTIDEDSFTVSGTAVNEDGEEVGSLGAPASKLVVTVGGVVAAVIGAAVIV